MLQNNYTCQIPIVLIIFNRPSETMTIIESLRIVRPKTIIVLSDGPRLNNSTDLVSVCNSRAAVESIDWECDLVKIYRETNFGCMRNIVVGLSEVFQQYESAIILEDDCKPNFDFFQFMEWGLERFKNDLNVGMISGSNLIADQIDIEERNGFSSLINIWGWGTWKDKWGLHNSLISIQEINVNCNEFLIKIGFNYWQRVFWQELFKFTVYCGNTWDFQLQYSFFKNNLISVYPRTNLIENIGFSGNGTHTNFSCPKYVSNNIPRGDSKIMFYQENLSKMVSLKRDIFLSKVIWNFNPYSALKLKIKNYLLALNFIS